MPERSSPTPEPRRLTLDELLDRADRPALESHFESDPDARRQAELQAQIDQSLARLFAAPDIQLDTQPARASRRVAVRWWAAAAAVGLLAFAGWRWWTISNRPDVLSPLYHSIVAAGFTPEQVCTDDKEFSGWCRQYLRQSIRVTARPAEIEYVGWNRAPVVSGQSGILLARVAGQPVLVIMEREEWLTTIPGHSRDPALHVFSRRIGEAVFYEISPRERAAILPVLEAGSGR